uniref:Uncharacterized protein n=1 Tax=Meloidogyne javanica TaxID=6303 RepID=A0A915M6W9_MELJA
MIFMASLSILQFSFANPVLKSERTSSCYSARQPSVMPLLSYYFNVKQESTEASSSKLLNKEAGNNEGKNKEQMEEPQKVQTFTELLNENDDDNGAEHLSGDRNKLDLEGRTGWISPESSSKANIDNYKDVEPTPEVGKRLDGVDLACEAHKAQILEELFRDIEAVPEANEAEQIPEAEHLPEDNNRRVDVDFTSLSSPSNEAPNHPSFPPSPPQQMPNHLLARNINNATDPKGKQVVREENQNYINFNQNTQQGYNPGLDTERLCQQYNQLINNSGYGPTASTLYHPHDYGQMRQHTMLDAQQNYNTNYLNNNIGHSRPPIASEPVVQPTANQSLNKKRVQFSEGTNDGKTRKTRKNPTKNNHEGTSNGKKRKTRKNPTEKNHETPLDSENNAENNNNSNNSLDNQQNVVEDFPNIFDTNDWNN